MRTPFYLGIRSLVLFESALRDVDRGGLRALLDDAAAGKADALDARKLKLVEAELSRRKAADVCALIAVVIAAFSFLAVL